MNEPLHRAKFELRSAARALERMRNAKNFEELEDSWRHYLSALERAWIKVERSCQQVRSQFEPWQGKFSEHRRKDPLLRYLKHARNADEHSLQVVLENVPGSSNIGVMGPSAYIEHLEIRGGQVVSYSGDQPLVQWTNHRRSNYAP